MLNKEGFLKKYNISNEAFDKTKINWEELEAIYSDYISEIPQLETSAIFIFNTLMKTEKVHSVRYRIKDAEHVIEKIIRKKIQGDTTKITVENYKTILTDLIGIRALHLFKEDWSVIHELIRSMWEFKEKPVANYRQGDSLEYLKKFEELDCTIKEHKFGYRSTHYVIETKPAKKVYYGEIQVRTIFEEAWSEIDHTIRYPYDQDNVLFGQFLLILNRLAGSADEMGTFIKSLKSVMQIEKEINEKKLSEKDKVINELQLKIQSLSINENEKESLNDSLKRLTVTDEHPTFLNAPLLNDYNKLSVDMAKAIHAAYTASTAFKSGMLLFNKNDKN